MKKTAQNVLRAQMQTKTVAFLLALLFTLHPPAFAEDLATTFTERAETQVSLGNMYGTGRSVPQDDTRAHMWWNLVAARGDEDALRKRDIIAKKMTPARIAEAQAAARACVAREYKGC